MNNTKKIKPLCFRMQYIRSDFMRDIVDMLPLCLSVLPWGLLAGSMAINSGLTFGQSIGMSAILYAGSAQLVTLGLLSTGANTFTIVFSVFFITTPHLLYGLTLRKQVMEMHLFKRLSVGFLLTDELFALSGAKKRSSPAYVYLMGAGFSFYLAWNLFSIMGIILAKTVLDLSSYHLDFSIVATFIAIVIPMIKK